ncbi:hypothetical protein TNCV_4697261 [Trichonephila clavipes]|nr:hypothetical protein TNCV_4697261 [Trichonephila clavipes]
MKNNVGLLCIGHILEGIFSVKVTGRLIDPPYGALAYPGPWTPTPSTQWINQHCKEQIELEPDEECNDQIPLRSSQALKCTYSTIRPVLEYTVQFGLRPLLLNTKEELGFVLYRTSKIIIGFVSSTNNKKAEQECGTPSLENRRDPTTISPPNSIVKTQVISLRGFSKTGKDQLGL